MEEILHQFMEMVYPILHSDSTILLVLQDFATIHSWTMHLDVFRTLISVPKRSPYFTRSPFPVAPVAPERRAARDQQLPIFHPVPGRC